MGSKYSFGFGGLNGSGHGLGATWLAVSSGDERTPIPPGAQTNDFLSGVRTVPMWGGYERGADGGYCSDEPPGLEDSLQCQSFIMEDDHGISPHRVANYYRVQRRDDNVEAAAVTLRQFCRRDQP